MKKFMGKDFLLSNKTSKLLYHNYASKLPIIDYECRLSAKDIADNRSCSNITELWLGLDHTKVCTMRACGVDEKYITGDASDYEKFREFCRIMPKLIGNPVYHLSHLELKRYFDCDLIINQKNCDDIWKTTADLLTKSDIGAKNLVVKNNVALLCIEEDPANSLEYYKQLSEDNFKVIPSFSPSRIFALENGKIIDYIKELEKANGIKITDLKSLFASYEASIARFDSLGCKSAVHNIFDYETFTVPDEYHADLIFKKALTGEKNILAEELSLFCGEMMYFFGSQYKKRGWVMQLHMGQSSSDKAKLIDHLSDKKILPRTVLCTFAPQDNIAIKNLIKNNTSDIIQSTDWQFNCGIESIGSQIKGLAETEALGKSIGFFTNSKSILSLARHEYFRRILCDVIGTWSENGLLDIAFDELAQLVCDICYNNAKNFFNFAL